MIRIPDFRTGRGLNGREHWSARARRVKSERAMVGWYLRQSAKPEPPLVVTLTRVAPSSGLDDDNLAGSLKAVRDEFAQWVGVDDKRRDVVRYEYAQERGAWSVVIHWRPMASGA